MSSLLSKSVSYRHETLLPLGTDVPAMKQIWDDHDWLFQLNPDYKSHVLLPAPADAKDPTTKRYKLTTMIEALEALKHILDPTVSCQVDVTDREKDTTWIVHAPLGFIQNSTYFLEEGTDERPGDVPSGSEKRVWLVEDTVIKGNRLLIGTFQSVHESTWNQTHNATVERLQKALKGTEG